MRPWWVVVLAGCGSGGLGDSELTCELLADPGNCWATAAAAAVACTPMHATPATLAADRASCSWPDGVRIVFDAPLPTDQLSLEHLKLTVEADGQTCASFEDTFMNKMILEAGGVMAISQLHPGRSFELACEDESYTADFDLLFQCAAEHGAVGPTDGFQVSTTSVEITIVSIATSGVWFTCVAP